MKKNFFKKLSFVLALAMVLSTLAPAASAFSATDPSLYVAKKYLYLNEEGKISEYDFNVKNKVKGSTYAWASDKEAVAEVDATGVTVAKAVGTAHITCTITLKDGTELKPLTATVVVRDNIETIDVVAPADVKEFAIGKEYDFNRSFTTFNGSQVKTSSISRWAVDNENATLDATNGKITFKKAGVFNLTVNAFQSNAQYEAWKVSKDATLVKATKTLKVTVDATVVGAKQVDADTFSVEFDSDMSKTDIATVGALFQIIAEKPVSTGTEKIKAVTFSADGKTVNVDMYASLAAGTSYKFVYGKLEAPFKAATKSLSEVTGIAFSNFDVTAGASVDMRTKVTGVNKDGVVIYTSADAEFISALSFANGADLDLTKAYVSGNNVYVYVKGYAAPVKATFSTSVYNATTLTYETKTFTANAVATGVTTDTSVNTANLAFQLSTAAPSSTTWTGSKALAAGDSGYGIFAKYYTNNAATTLLYTTVANELAYTYTSTDTSKLLISGTAVYPIAAGVVTVVVKNTDGVAVSTFDVVINAARTYSQATQSGASVTVGNHLTQGETGTVSFYAKDSLGATLLPTVTASVQQSPTGSDVSKIVLVPSVNALNAATDPGKATVAVTARGASAGAYYVKATLGATVNGVTTSKDLFFTVIVADSNTANTVATWKVELGTSAVDLKALYATTNITVNVGGYNAAGFKVAQLAASDFSYDVLSGADKVVTAASNTSIAVATATSGAALVVNRAAGTYSVVANVVNNTGVFAGRAVGSYIASTTFTVSNTTALTKTLEDPIFDAGDTILTAIQEAYKFSLNGTEVTNETTIVNVKYSLGDAAGLVNGVGAVLSANSNVYVDSFTYRVTDATSGAYVDYVYTVGNTFAVK